MHEPNYHEDTVQQHQQYEEDRSPHDVDAVDVWDDLVGWLEEGCRVDRLGQPWLSDKFQDRNEKGQNDDRAENTQGT